MNGIAPPSSALSSAQIAAVASSNSKKTSMDSTSSSSNGNAKTVHTPIWEQSAQELESWAYEHDGSSLFKVNIPTTAGGALPLAVLRNVWKTLETALESLQLQEIALPMEQVSSESGSPVRKRRKRIKKKLVDPYHLWVHVKKTQDDNADETGADKSKGTPQATPEMDVPDSPGGKLAVLCVGGLINAMAGIPDGITKKVTPSTESLAAVKTPSPTGVTMTDLLALAHAWHRSIQLQVHRDILTTTPRRIQEMLAADLSEAEFGSIRKRIYDTVLLGKGLHANEPAADADTTLATGPSATVHDIDKFKKCKYCGNNDQAAFVLDRKNGDVICINCGTVNSESIMHEGSAFRKFEGEVDRNHHGDAPNSLYSNAHNLSTSLSGVSQTTGAGMGGWRSGGGQGGRNMETILRNAHAYTELNISQFGKTDRRTRIGYKDRQKKEAFVQMAHAGDALNLHEAVVQRAKELFAGFRDDRELVQQFKGVIAGCLCEAFEQLSAAGAQILKPAHGQEIKPEPVAPEKPASGDADAAQPHGGSSESVLYNKRAARRKELHHTNLAGKGGLLLDYSDMDNKSSKSAAEKATHSPTNGVDVNKQAASWELEDCRRWLLEASRQIAQEWVEAREKKTEGVPSGSLEELEGRLVEHTFTLCEHLEQELQSKQKNSGSNRVVTPRVNNMDKLGIKWQSSHERGAGANPTGPKSTRTAGQLLLLKTAKKLGSILSDPVAGDAIHKKLREVVGKHEMLKSQGRREEASRQRLLQMKRKPWLQARLQT